MRLIKQAYEYIKEQDPETALTYVGFRTLITEGKIPVVKIGKKTLVNLQTVDDYFSNPDMAVEEVDEICANISPIRRLS